MATGACGIDCDVCRLNLLEICATCGPGTSEEAAAKIEVQNHLFGCACPILDCARTRRVSYCLRDCGLFPCENFEEGPYPYSRGYLKMQRRRRAETRPARAPSGGIVTVPTCHWEALSHEDVDTLCAWALAERHSERALRLTVLNSQVVIDLDRHRIEPLAPESFRTTDRNLLELLVLVYLMGVTADRLSGDMISVQELKDARFFQGPHTLHTAPLLRRYANDIEGFSAAAQRLGGRPRALADAAFALFPFPKVPLYYLLWKGDAEFGAHLSILFDRSIEMYLAADAIWGTVNMVSALLL